VEFPVPPSFNDTYRNRQAAEEQDMSIEKTMVLHDDLKVNVDYNKAPFNRMTTAQRKAYSDYYSKVTAEYEKIKDDPAALRTWKFQRYMKDYLATAKGLDRNVGRILDELDKMGLKQNTIVVYTSDQGFYMGEHGWFDKRFMYEESLRTPFMIRYPGKIKSGLRLTGMVVNIDYAPTLLELAGVKTNASWQGESFAPVLTGAPWVGRDAMYYHYYEYPDPHRVAKHFGVRTERFKLIRFYHPMKSWELYDLQKDRYETENVYADPAYRDIAMDLKQKLRQLIIRYKDDEALKLMEP
jgi:arylsulfatase A-like enzyme